MPIRRKIKVGLYKAKRGLRKKVGRTKYKARRALSSARSSVKKAYGSAGVRKVRRVARKTGLRTRRVARKVGANVSRNRRAYAVGGAVAAGAGATGYYSGRRKRKRTRRM